MNTQQEPTRSPANAHNEQSAADTNNTRIIRYKSELKRAFAERLARHFAHGADLKPPACAYSRKQALAEGLEVQVPPEVMEEMGTTWDLSWDYPLFLTKKLLRFAKLSAASASMPIRDHCGESYASWTMPWIAPFSVGVRP